MGNAEHRDSCTSGAQFSNCRTGEGVCFVSVPAKQSIKTVEKTAIGQLEALIESKPCFSTVGTFGLAVRLQLCCMGSQLRMCKVVRPGAPRANDYKRVWLGSTVVPKVGWQSSAAAQIQVHMG